MVHGQRIYIIELDPATGYPLIAQSLVEREVTVNTAEPGVTATETKLVPSSADDPAFGLKYSVLLQVKLLILLRKTAIIIYS